MALGLYLVCLLLVTTTSFAVEEQVLLNFYNDLGIHPLFPAKSCREIYKYNYASHDKSGYYWIQPSADDDTIKVQGYNYHFMIDCRLMINLLCRYSVRWSYHVVEGMEGG